MPDQDESASTPESMTAKKKLLVAMTAKGTADASRAVGPQDITVANLQLAATARRPIFIYDLDPTDPMLWFDLDPTDRILSIP